MYWNFNYSSLTHSTIFSLVANSVAMYDKLEQSVKATHYKAGSLTGLLFYEVSAHYVEENGCFWIQPGGVKVLA